MADSPRTSFQLQVSLKGMKPEDSLQIMLPSDYAQLGVWDLLESVFPAGGPRQAEVETKLDIRANPDLPEIFDVLLDAFAQWRLGYCSLYVSTDDSIRLDPSDSSQKYLKQLQSKEELNSACLLLHLTIEQEYLAIDYAVRQGHWETREELLEWLQVLTLLYFLDKHESELPPFETADADPGLLTIASVLFRENLALHSVETGMIRVTESGRQLIGRLLAETESYIDRFDLFKDVAYDFRSESVEFDTGDGEDLRAQIFEAEGLDPIRAVFLLRLYDGSFDEFAPDWPRLILNAEFFDEILQPAVNHDRVEVGTIGRVIEIGYALIEEGEEAARELRSQQSTLKRFRSRTGPSAEDIPNSSAARNELD